MLRVIILIGFSLLISFSYLSAQFSPAAGFPGSDAIPANDSRFVEWADHCTIQRGWQDAGDHALGVTTVGDSLSATGPAGTNGVVSLGDGGVATLTFDQPIYDGAGFDFAVFENGFTTNDSGSAFLEFAFVEVSSDGVHFFRFPAVSHIQDTVQMAMEGVDCSLVNNLAGKYVAGYGTPFDLGELKNVVGLDIQHITHVRLIDVVGSINPLLATYDSENHKINDPYPTPFASGGFDLDAVGVFHAVGISDIHNENSEMTMRLFPNPIHSGLVTLTSTITEPGILKLSDVMGQVIQTKKIKGGEIQLNIQGLPPGMYLVSLQSADRCISRKLQVR